MSTFLQLAQKLKRETVDSGSISTVVSQTGENLRFVSWLIDAWTEMQQDRDDWRWMRKSFTVNTVSGTGSYAYTACTDTVTAIAIARFSRWYRNTFKCYLTASGVGAEYPLTWMEWEQFRRIYRYGTQTDGQPVHFSQDPTGAFVLGPKPSAVYVVSGDYQIGPQTLALDADEPEMPAKYHNLVVYEAMAKYGGSRIAPEAMVRAIAEGGRLRDALEREQLPAITWGRPLAEKHASFESALLPTFSRYSSLTGQIVRISFWAYRPF